MNSTEASKQIVDVCHRLARAGLVANHDGNVTFRLDGQIFLATPTSFAKIDVTPENLISVDREGKVVAGKHKVFSEIFWHLAIYRLRPEVKCVVHAHPPTAGAYGLVGREIGTPCVPEAIVSLGRAIRTMDFFSPLDGSIKKTGSLFELELKRVLDQCDTFVAAGNGAWAVGENILQTYLRMELVEHIAKQHFAAEALGKLRALPLAVVEELLAKRAAPGAPSSPDLVKEIVRQEILESLRED